MTELRSSPLSDCWKLLSWYLQYGFQDLGIVLKEIVQSQIFVGDACSSLTLPDRVTSPLPVRLLITNVYFNQRDADLGGLVAVNIQESEIAARQENRAKYGGVALCRYEC